MSVEPTSDPWERRSGESSPAFEAFARYRDAGIERSIRGVAQELGKSATLLARWSSANDWVARAAAWDAEQDRRWRNQIAARRRRAIDRHINMAQLAQTKVAARLMGLDEQTLSATELTRLLDVAVRIEREALGEPQRLELTGADGDPVSVQVAEFAAMGAEQRRLAIADIAAAVSRRVQAATGTDDDDD